MEKFFEMFPFSGCINSRKLITDQRLLPEPQIPQNVPYMEREIIDRTRSRSWIPQATDSFVARLYPKKCYHNRFPIYIARACSLSL